MSQGCYVDQKPDFNPEEWDKSNKQLLEIMRNLRTANMNRERQSIKSEHPEISYEDYLTKIKQSEKNIPKPGRKFLNDETSENV